MVKSYCKYNFANQWLNKNNVTIISGNEQILMYEKDIYDINFQLPFLIPGNFKITEKTIKKIFNYQILLDRGLAVYSKRATGRFFKKQGLMYMIERRNPFKKDIGRVPELHYVEWELSTNSFRLRGRNAGYMGIGSWISLNQKKENFTRYSNTPSGIMRHAENIQDSWSPIKFTKPIRKIRINEIPIIKCPEKGKIICIKDSPNEPVIGWVGEREMGKSFGINSTIGRMYWYWKKKIAVLNDITKESHSFCLPWYSDSSFNKQLKLLNEVTLPLPCVFLTPQIKNLDNVLLEEEGVGFRMSLPFKEIMDDFNSYTKGSELTLGKSEKYLDELKSELIKCKSMDEIRDILMNKVDKEELHEKSAQAILSTINKIYNKEILDISNGIPPYWRIIKKDEEGDFAEDIEYPPIIASLYADLVPIVITSNIINDSHFPQIFKYWASQILTVQSEDSYFLNNQISIIAVVDELQRVASKRNVTVASETIQEFATAGRQRRVGLVYGTQNYSKVFDTIRQNTQYLFAVKQKKKEAKEIADDYDLDKNTVKELINLKPFEVIACGKFITYDEEGERKEEYGSFKGYTFPPLNMHTVPKKVVEIVQ